MTRHDLVERIAEKFLASKLLIPGGLHTYETLKGILDEGLKETWGHPLKGTCQEKKVFLQ